MKVIKVKYNWRQVGSIADIHGAGEDYDWVQVGHNDIILIEEFESKNLNEVWNYVAHYKNGDILRIFNPNTVEYITEK